MAGKGDVINAIAAVVIFPKVYKALMMATSESRYRAEECPKKKLVCFEMKMNRKIGMTPEIENNNMLFPNGGVRSIR